jgi:dTDP-4-dehydrorhamnose reductase
MKILLLGKNGQVGFELQRTLLPFGDVLALGQSEANFNNPAGLNDLLRDALPNVIVNAAAYTAVDKAEADESEAFKVNAEAVGVLASYSRQSGALLVHYSTDYVFDGAKHGAYVETDPTNPQSVYGRSKRAGEDAVMKSGCNALVFRTSWVFSAHGANFIKTILRLAKERDSLNVVADQLGVPTSAELIADITALSIAAYHYGRIAARIYHLVPAGVTTWHGLAQHVVERAQANGLRLKLSLDRINPICTEQYPLPAKRPKNSRLDTGKLTVALGLHLPDWKNHVNRTVDRLTLLEATA